MLQLSKNIIESVKIKCPKTKKKVDIPFNKVDLYVDADNCELCGGHIKVEIEFLCQCKEYHRIILRDD